MSDPVRIGILDDCDAPEAKMLVIAVGPPGEAWIEYLDLRRPQLSRRREAKPASLSRWTDAAAFGVSLSLCEGAQLRVVQTGASVATYKDGVPRPWHGAPTADIPIRRWCVPALVRFFQLRAADRPSLIVVGRPVAREAVHA